MKQTETQSRGCVQRLVRPGWPVWAFLWLTVISYLLLRVIQNNGERLTSLERCVKATEFSLYDPHDPHDPHAIMVITQDAQGNAQIKFVSPVTNIINATNVQISKP